jgi:hypothetical protein
MYKIAFAILLATFALGLGGCGYVEDFYAARCTDWGGTWAGSGGCQGSLF